MKMAFICNQNQARSQVLGSVFAALLPTDEFSSFGLIASEGAPLPIVIESVFHDWGLDPTDRFARNMGLHWDEIRLSHVAIAVTSFIAEEVKAAGFLGAILDLELEANRHEITITDPQLMPRRQCAFELAKYAKVAVSALQGIGVMKGTSNILALIPENEAAIEKTVALALAQVDENSSLLFGDLIVPPSRLALKSSLPLSQFKVDESSDSIELLTSIGGQGIYLPRSAAMQPAKVYLSRYWLDFVIGMAREPLIIVTPPLKNATGRLAESYLCALHADEIRVVQS